jgi:arylsulfatase
MVSRLDRTVGRIMAKLRELKIEKNTLIFFTSDNGPTHNVGGADSTFFKSAGKLRGLKGSLYEGGIRVPLIASWPGTIKPGTSDRPIAFWDVLPTLLDVSGTDNDKLERNLDGVSFHPTLMGREQAPREFLYWEFPGSGGQQAVIVRSWKAIRQQLNKGTVKTELYELETDPGETTDVAMKNPEVLKELEAVMKREHVPSKLFPMKAID